MRVLQVNIERCSVCERHKRTVYREDIVGVCEHQKDSLGNGRIIYTTTQFVDGFPIWCELEELEEVKA